MVQRVSPLACRVTHLSCTYDFTLMLARADLFRERLGYSLRARGHAEHVGMHVPAPREVSANPPHEKCDLYPLVCKGPNPLSLGGSRARTAPLFLATPVGRRRFPVRHQFCGILRKMNPTLCGTNETAPSRQFTFCDQGPRCRAHGHLPGRPQGEVSQPVWM